MYTSLRIFVSVLFLSAMLVACGGSSATTDAPPADNTASESEPESTDSTNGAAEDNSEELSEEVDASSDGGDTNGEVTNLVGRLSFAGSTTVQPLVEELKVIYQEQYPEMDLEVAAGGSGVGIQAIQDGTADIGMASRDLREGEQTPGMEVFPIAIDVLAVIVHPSNPVRELSSDELKSIYTGEISNWSEVGGEDGEIAAIVREETSGTRGAFDEIALDDEPNREDAVIEITAGEVEARVAENPNAIGYVGFGHVVEGEIALVSIDGVQPSPATALDGTYRLKRPLQLLTGPLSRPEAQSFVDFALSSVGQETVVEKGWVRVQ